MTWYIPLFKMHWEQDNLDYINTAINYCMNWAVVANATQFENKLGDNIGIKYYQTLNLGISLHNVELITFGIGNGDEVLVPSFTFIATVNAPQFVEAELVYADIGESTLELKPESMIENITSKIKNDYAVPFWGLPLQEQGVAGNF